MTSSFGASIVFKWRVTSSSICGSSSATRTSGLECMSRMFGDAFVLINDLLELKSQLALFEVRAHCVDERRIGRGGQRCRCVNGAARFQHRLDFTRDFALKALQ